MKLTTRIFIFFIIFMVAWSGFMAFILPSNLLKSFESLESDSFDSEIKRVENGIEQLVARHESILLDWTKWDDAYQYVMQPYDAFISVNMPPNLYEDQQINYVLLFDYQDTLSFAGGYDYYNGITIDTPPEMAEVALAHPNTSGIILIDNTPYIMTSFRVTNSKESVQAVGLMVFISELTNKQIDELGGSLKEEIKIIDYHQSRDYSKHHLDLQATHATAQITIPYLNVEEGITFSITLERSITALGKKSIRDTWVLSFISFALMTCFFYLWLRRHVIKIDQIAEDVEYITDKHDLSRRITLSASGEIEMLKLGINSMLEEITMMHRQLTNFAKLDPLTGILNRRGGFEKLNALLEEASDKHLDLTISFIDINDLKIVNDTLGHNEGDNYLKKVTEVIASHTRQSDIFCRLGGDEFLLIYPLCDAIHAEESMERISSTLAALQESVSYNMSISYGIASYKDNLSLAEFVELADQRMYEHKSSIKKAK